MLAAADAEIWVLLDDRAGNRSQALGVAERLGSAFLEVEITYGPLIRLPNAILGASLLGLDGAAKARLGAPWPSVVIAAGRRTAPVARWIKRQNPNTKLVHIMDPGAGHAEFDLICRPVHDKGAPSGNVLEIIAAPHRFSPSRLDDARENRAGSLSDLSMPRIAAFIGGSTRRRQFTDAMALDLCEQLNAAVSRLNGSILATTSRRTGLQVGVIAENLSVPYQLYRWDQGGDNPYEGYLASADAIVVTGESVSMCSEALATGKPVYIYAPDDLITEKHARLHQNLISGGHARPFNGDIDLAWQPDRLDVCETIVSKMRSRGIIKAA